MGLFQKASYKLTCVIYTAWQNAGNTTNISGNENHLPSGFILSQNYPNPFNPSTKIKYSISSVIANEVKQSQIVSLRVYDVLGNEIETLVDEEKSAGTYEITWYAEGLPSGVYFYRLQTGSFIETKKMLLLK
ncbi:MAG: T9SS type A sorting domain-containing protein [bacterium]|nr:T9SS type A sorting domain-containing protein [bacterium]